MASTGNGGQQRFLALDMGAESGRGVVGTVSEKTVTLEEVHRFPNGPVRLGPTLYWDLPRLHAEQVTAIGKAAAGGQLSGIGVDTWGVDFGLLDDNGDLAGLPVHYRDARTNGMPEKVFAQVPRAEVFARTGIQIMPINTLFQFAALAKRSPKLLEAADKLLFIPDLFHYYLTGRADAEFTIATTSQMYDPVAGDWARQMLHALNLPTHLLPAVVPAGTEYGALLPGIASETGAGATVPVIAPAGHDTACAVAAVPAEAGEDWAYLSSGTWSLLGVEIDKPLINADTEAANFTNEGGVDNTFRLLKNIGGLWLVQECRRAWARAGSNYGYEELTAMAAAAPPLAALVDPDDASLLAPADMPAAIRALCAASGQIPPDSPGALVRCALDSLALKYRWTLEKMEQVTGRTLRTLHIVGGTQNTLLNQIAADATGRLVKAGPVEATAIGNVLLQARAQGLLHSLADLRSVVRASFPITTYEPSAATRNQWEDAYDRFTPLLASSE